MPRGEAAEVGTEKVSQNGYVYVKTENGWRLKHHLVAEKKLKRSLHPDERVSFVDGDRRNLDPKNIKVAEVGKTSHSRKSAQRRLWIVERKIEALQEEVRQIKGLLEG